jgi:two-component system, chemotaxis family, protein-glutamate methylesterase/glutaminase
MVNPGVNSKNSEINGKKLADHQRVVVIGASAGGLEAIKKLIQSLPSDFSAPIFIVWHMSPDIQGIIPRVLNNLNAIYAANAYDGEPIQQNRIYFAPPDRHMLIEEGVVRLSQGPKENHFRPAVDPLFRSAAYVFGNRVIGIILSGSLDDGTAGLWRIKHNGGTAIVQNPQEAEVPSMPQNAIREVNVDYIVSVAEMAALLVRLSKRKVNDNPEEMKDEKTKIEIDIAAGKSEFSRNSLVIGELSPYSCPECQGVLSKITDGNLSRFRCHTGHAYSIDTLLSSISEKIESSLYTALGALEESIMLLNHMGDHLAESKHTKLAALYFNKAKKAEERVEILRNTVMGNEHLSNIKLILDFEKNEKKEK